jgi:hypothetical protein
VMKPYFRGALHDLEGLPDCLMVAPICTLA